MRLISIALILLVVGCHNVETRTYDVTLHNQSSKPLTIWLTKNGPVYEDGWRSPEDLAMLSTKQDEHIGGVVVPAGKTAVTGKLKGQFEPHVDAILRIYMGQRGFNELLATSSGSPSRVDLPLTPGINDVVVTDDGPGMKITHTP